MRINRLYDYASLTRVTHPVTGKRHYLCPDTGSKLPSVTTILDSSSDKSFLVEWERRIGKEKAGRERKYATDLGTLMHTHLEHFVNGDPRPGGTMPMRKLAEKMADVVIERGLPEVDEVWGQEVGLYFPHLYAGTTDLVGLHRGTPAIMDYKTAKKLRQRAQIENYFLQMAAYALAHNWKYGTNINKGVIYMVARDLSYAQYVIEGREFDYWCGEWQSKMLAYHASNGDDAQTVDMALETA